MSESDTSNPPAPSVPKAGEGNATSPSPAEQVQGFLTASSAERLRLALKNRWGLVALGLLSLLQASGYVDLSQVFVWVGLATSPDQIWGSTWGGAPW